MAAYKPALTTLGYILSPDRTRVLMVHRNARPEDHHYGKYNGLGGRLEPGEDVASGLCREIHEESGLTVEAMTLRGTICWPGFGPQGEDRFGFIFLVDKWTGEPPMENEEGRLEWVPVDALHGLNLWEGDRYWLDMVFDADPRPFHGLCPYRDGRPVSWSFVRM